MSEYENVRAENIKKNEEFLRSIGLYESKFEISGSSIGENKFLGAKEKRKSENTKDSVPQRRSRRLDNLIPEVEGANDIERVENRAKAPPIRRASIDFVDQDEKVKIIFNSQARNYSILLTTIL